MRSPRIKYAGPRRGHFLREWRTRALLSQDELCAKSAVSKATISRIENGIIGYTEDTLEALAAALGVGPAEILTPPALMPAQVLRASDLMGARDQALLKAFNLP